MPNGRRATGSQGLVPTKTPSLGCAEGLAGEQVAIRITDRKANFIDTILFMINLPLPLNGIVRRRSSRIALMMNNSATL
jgi:hypothetical protein